MNKPFTFKDYIQNYTSEYTLLYKEHLSLDILPNRVCSSKTIYNLLKPQMEFNTFKQKIFRETFNEYFTIKISCSDNLDFVDR